MLNESFVWQKFDNFGMFIESGALEGNWFLAKKNNFGS